MKKHIHEKKRKKDLLERAKCKRIAAYVIMSLIIIIAVPLVIDWCIIGNSIPSHISNSEWVGFLGGYIGAILGAIVSLIGIIITIRYTSAENRKDRQLEIRPYCMVSEVDKKEIKPEYQRLEYSFQYNPMAETITDYSRMQDEAFYVRIENIGIGPAIDWEIEQIQKCTFDSPTRECDIGYGLVISDNCIKSKESIYIILYVYFKPWEGDLNKDWRDKNGYPGSELLLLYPTCHLSYTLTYSDMIGTRYCQEYGVRISFSAAFSQDGKLHENVKCSVALEKASVPRQIIIE